MDKSANQLAFQQWFASAWRSEVIRELSERDARAAAEQVAWELWKRFYPPPPEPDDNWFMPDQQYPRRRD